MNAPWTARRLIAVAALLVALFLLATVLPKAAAQTPQGMNCAPPLKQSAGGESVVSGKILVYLPQGYHYVMNVPEQGVSGGTLRICVIEYLAQIEFNTDTGAEKSRTLTIPVVADLFDVIAGSARLLAPPTPTPAPTLPPAVVIPDGAPSSPRSTCTSSICPPNTGDAGLR